MRVLTTVTSVLLAFLIVLAAFFTVYYDQGANSVYDARANSWNAQEQEEVSAILAFLDGKQADLTFLSADEARHMDDVRDVFETFRTIAIIVSVIVVAVLLVLVIVPFIVGKCKTKKNEKKKNDVQRDVKNDVKRNYYEKFRDVLATVSRTSGIIVLIACVLLALSTLFSFDSFWTAFHLVLFPQGNWMFPLGSTLIALFPETFFQHFAQQVLLAAASYGIVALAASSVLKRKPAT